jgi:hypothetical protein
MNSREWPGQAIPALLAQPKFEAGLMLLLDAGRYAEQTGCHPWDFAVEAPELCSRGLSVNDLRLLMRLKYVEHAREITAPGDSGRRFQRAAGSSFTGQSCFVLTAAGMKTTAKLLNAPATKSEQESPTIPMVRNGSPVRKIAVPHWSRERHVLSFDGLVVKQFRWPAANQELVLTTFQEERWPVRILDPLAPDPAQVVKQRLSETIRSLNRGQVNALLHFRGDGTGEGIVWEAVV